MCNKLNLESVDEVMTANNFCRICANSWVYRSELCNGYVDVLKDGVLVRVETTGTNLMSINHSVEFDTFDFKLPMKIQTMCDLISSVSSSAVAQIKIVLDNLEAL